MIKIENTWVGNFENAIRGMRNSWNSWHKSDSRIIKGIFVMGVNDFDLAFKLSKAGGSHAKFLRQIFVSCDIIAPDYWWVEEATYKVGTTENSISTMHTFGKEEKISVEAYGFDNPDDPLVREYMDLINRAKDAWHTAGKKQGMYEWRRLIQLNARAFLYKRTFSGNYQVLKNMYHDRKNHRLQEWREFCDWIRSLPYSDLITLGE